ncbi:unnamed protein product [Gadus morhua 'NCC']
MLRAFNPEPVKDGVEVEHLRTEDILQWNHYRLRSPSTQQDCRTKSGFQCHYVWPSRSRGEGGGERGEGGGGDSENTAVALRSTAGAGGAVHHQRGGGLGIRLLQGP